MWAAQEFQELLRTASLKDGVQKSSHLPLLPSSLDFRSFLPIALQDNLASPAAQEEDL